MPDFFKKLSTFRIIIIWLLILSAGFHFHGWLSRRGVSWWDSGDGRQVYSVLTTCVEDAARIFVEQELLTLSLAARLEALPDSGDRDAVERAVAKTLEEAPDSILGLGMALAGREAAYASRDGSTLETIGLAGGDALPVRSNGERMSWTLLTGKGEGGEPEYSSLLTILIDKPLRGTGILKTNLSWLPPLLRRLMDTGEVGACCVAPDGSFLWLDGGRLHSDKTETPDADSPPGILLKMAREAVKLPTPLADRQSFIADVGGTEWHLMAVRPPLRSRFFTLSVSLLTLAVAALLFEAVITYIVGKGTELTSSLDAANRHKKGNHWLARLNTILFQYRILNPHRERLESELRVAREIQFSLVPAGFPEYSEWREFDLYALLSPAREVGGDYYDYFMLDSNRLVLAVGDVSGKGVPAALYMAVCRTAFRTLAREAQDPGNLLTQLNNLLVRDNHSGLYITIACIMVDLANGRCQYSLAGHPAPLLRVARTSAVAYVDTPRETVVGLKAGVRYPMGEMRLARGDTLLLYTDGVSEARNPAGDELDYPALLDMFHASAGAESCRWVVEGLDKELKAYMHGRAQEDDITMQAFRYWGAGGRKMRLREDWSDAAEKRDGNG